MTPIELAEEKIKQRGGIWTKEGWIVKKGLNLSFLSLSTLPKIKFVGGYFLCSSNQLANLIGSPRYVGEYFNCWNNPLKSLSGLPDKIGENFYCNDDLALPKEEILLLIKAHPRNLERVIKKIKWIIGYQSSLARNVYS